MGGSYEVVRTRRPVTVNSALAAVDDLNIRRHLRPANANRVEPRTPPPRPELTAGAPERPTGQDLEAGVLEETSRSLAHQDRVVGKISRMGSPPSPASPLRGDCRPQAARPEP